MFLYSFEVSCHYEEANWPTANREHDVWQRGFRRSQS
jgi:hypothetical protein